LPPIDTRFFFRWREVGADGTGKMHYPAQQQSIQDCSGIGANASEGRKIKDKARIASSSHFGTQ
jgi:hypothetical protein